MISDVLFDAIREIERYQNDPVFKKGYVGMEEEIESVKNAMNQLLEKLDTPPADIGETDQ